jgi:hypothetical protein
MERLEPLTGRWDVTMTMTDGSQHHGWATFEWLGAYLVWRQGAEHPQAPESLTLVGPDESGEAFVQHYFDSRGVQREYALDLRDGVLTLHRDHPGFTQHFEGTFSDDGRTITGAWQMNGELDFDLVYTR